MDQLTEDEYTVLGIAAEGASMMAIGRWEKAVESLVAKKMMQQNDKFNNFILPAGREALKVHETKVYTDVIEASNAIANAKSSVDEMCKIAVTNIVRAAQIASHTTGDSLKIATGKILSEVVRLVEERM